MADAAGRERRRSCRRTTGCRRSLARYTRDDLPGGLERLVEADYTRFRRPTRSLSGTSPTAQRSLRAGADQPALAGARAGSSRPSCSCTRTSYQFDAPAGQRRALGQPHGADLQPGQRPGVRARRQLSSAAASARRWSRARSTSTRRFATRTAAELRLGANDFNFATIYTENAFGGNDRISDNNLLTLGVTTRLLDPDTGAEAARFGIAQRLRFKDQLVTLPGGAPVSERLSDMLFGARSTGRRKWSVDAHGAVQPQDQAVDPLDHRRALQPRQLPRRSAPPTAASADCQRAAIDVGWQWPLNDLWGDKGQNLGPGRGQGEGRWYSVGRLNCSLKDRRLVDAVRRPGIRRRLLARARGVRAAAKRHVHSEQAHPVPARVRRLHAGSARAPCRASSKISPVTSTCASRSPRPAASAITTRVASIDEPTRPSPCGWPARRRPSPWRCRPPPKGFASRAAAGGVAGRPRARPTPAPRRGRLHRGRGQFRAHHQQRSALAHGRASSSSWPSRASRVPPRAEFARQVLERLISEKAQLQLAQRKRHQGGRQRRWTRPSRTWRGKTRSTWPSCGGGWRPKA